MNLKKTLPLIAVVAASIAGCGQQTLNPDYISFNEDSVVVKNFKGIGVEWGAYEDTNKLKEDYWDVTTRAVDRLSPQLVRCMISYDWFVKNLDKHGNDDINDDTWEYDFNNKWMKSACEILEYCVEHNIEVAFGAWNPIGSPDESVDEWGMIKNTTADIRWAKMTVDVLSYLVKVKGYNCIKYFVNSNEPNYVGIKGQSKNAYNTYEKWEQGVRNVRAALDEAGLNNIDIVGGDVTGAEGCKEYLPNIAKNLKNVVNNYGIHMYVDDYFMMNGSYQKGLTELYDTVKKEDKEIGESKDYIIWEAGMLTGKDTVSDCNRYIRNFSYGLRIADYTVSSLLAHINGIVYWDLDDAMHFMYTETGTTPKEWGMFSTLASDPVAAQELRPWYHAATMFTNLLRRGSKIYSPDQEQENFKVLASVDGKGENGGMILVNRDIKSAVEKTYTLQRKVTNNEKVYVYIFNESSMRLDENGFIKENLVLDCSINDSIKVSVPANSAVVLSSKKL